jgi:hypothetical protein
MKNPNKYHAKHSNTFKKECILQKQLYLLNNLANTIDEYYWDIEKEGINTYVLRSINESVCNSYEKLNMLFNIESEFILKEIENISKLKTAAESIKKENQSILLVMEELKKLLQDTESIRKDKEILQAEMISLEHNLKRIAEKKKKLIVSQIQKYLPAKKLEEMKNRIYQEGYLTT